MGSDHRRGRGQVDEPQPLTDDELETMRRERAFALILGAVLQQDATGDVELAWRVAEMVAGEDR